MKDLSKLYEELEAGYYVVPDIQRDFVWRNHQVLELAVSIYGKLPVGAFYVCDVPSDIIEEYYHLFKPLVEEIEVGSSKLIFDVKRGKYVIIDGRQRLTSLLLLKYGRIKINDEVRRVELYFNPWSQDFQLAKGGNKPKGCWFKVSEILRADDIEDVVDSVDCSNVDKRIVRKRLDRLRHVFSTYKVPIVDIEVGWNWDDPIEVFEKWSEMFVRLNSRGTKVKLHDLVIALITGKTIRAGATSFRERFHRLIKELEKKGYNVDAPPLVRAYLAISTGEIKFKEASQRLGGMSPEQHLNYLDATRESLLKVFEIMREFGIRFKYLESVYLPVTPAIAIHKRYLAARRPIDERYKRDIVTWFVYASFDRRYTGRLESDLYEDISTLSKNSYEVGALLKNLRTKGIDMEDLTGEYGKRHLTLLSVLYAHNKAKDWDVESTDPKKVVDIPEKELSEHHIFPRVVLKKSGYDEELWNDVGNITLISKTANEKFKEEPLSYLKKLKEADPAFLELHFVPTDENLWRIENYEEFLKRRRQLILQACKTLFTTTTG
jgi:hypothetical protein